MALQLLSRVGNPPVKTDVLPVIQGVTVIGMQGIGTSTPKAAAVAAATIGLLRLVQTPNVGMSAMGVKFMIVPTCVIAVTMAIGVAFNAVGAAPKVHVSTAPVTQICGITLLIYIKIEKSLHVDLVEAR